VFVLGCLFVSSLGLVLDLDKDLLTNKEHNQNHLFHHRLV